MLPLRSGAMKMGPVHGTIGANKALKMTLTGVVLGSHPRLLGPFHGTASWKRARRKYVIAVCSEVRKLRHLQWYHEQA